MVHLQRDDRTAPRACATYEPCAIGSPSKVTGPLISSGVKQGRQLPADGILSTHSLSFVQVAASTSVGQVVSLCDASACLWRYVLDVKLAASDQLIAVTIFTTIVGARCNLPPQLFGDVGHRCSPA